MLAASFAFFGLVFGVPIARLDAWWSVLLAAVVGALVGLPLAEYGIGVSRSKPSAPLDDAQQ